MKQEIFQAVAGISTIVWLHHLDSNETFAEKDRWELHKNTVCYSEQILEVAPYKTAAIRPLTSHLTNYLSKVNKSCW